MLPSLCAPLTPCPWPSRADSGPASGPRPDAQHDGPAEEWDEQHEGGTWQAHDPAEAWDGQPEAEAWHEGGQHATREQDAGDELAAPAEDDDSWETDPDQYGWPDEADQLQQHERRAPSAAWDEQQQQQQQQQGQDAGDWAQQDPWGQDDQAAELSGRMAGVQLAEPQAAGQPPPAAWQQVEPAPSAARPPVGSPLCPGHFATGECDNGACELAHGGYCEVGAAPAGTACATFLPSFVHVCTLKRSAAGADPVPHSSRAR